MSEGDVHFGRRVAAEDGSLALLRAWRAERMPWMRYGPLALLIAWAASVGAPFDAPTLALRLLLAWMLVAQFRLWDDLVDRGRDLNAHPERLLSRHRDVDAAAVACVLMGLWNLLTVLFTQGVASGSVLVVLSVLLAAWYRMRRQRDVLHAHVLLLKYPAFVLVLGANPVDPSTGIVAVLIVYSAMCAFEVADAGRATRLMQGTLVVHGAVMVLAACGARVDLAGVTAAGLVATIWGLLLVGRRDRPVRKYLPFIAAIVVLARLTLGVSL